MMKTSKVDFLDINVWLALADENHEHHIRARHYWENESLEFLAFCRVTMLGFLRLITHPKVMKGQPLSASQAWDAYQAFIALPEVKMFDEHPKLEVTMRKLTDRPDFPASQWTDSYLAAVAISTHSRLVSFDSDFYSIKNLEFLHLR